MDNPFKNFKLEDRLPPQNLEAEQCLLGSLMLDKKAVFKVIDFLSANDFYRDTHKIVFEAILFLFEKGEPIDLVTVSNRLKETKLLDKIGGMTYLTELVNSDRKSVV